MGSQSYLAMKRNELLAISAELLREPNMPVMVICSEAKFLAVLAEKYKTTLARRKLDWSLVESLNPGADALQEAQTAYMMSQFADPKLADEFARVCDEAMELREQLVHEMLYAFDGNETLLGAVRTIMQGSSYADLAQDMSDLEGLGREHPDKLEEAGVDFALVERAGELKKPLGDLLAMVNLEKLEKSPEKEMRDRAFTNLDMAMDRIRKAGKSVFWKDPQIAAQFASDYSRRKRRIYKKVRDAAEVTA